MAQQADSEQGGEQYAEEKTPTSGNNDENLLVKILYTLQLLGGFYILAVTGGILLGVFNDAHATVMPTSLPIGALVIGLSCYAACGVCGWLVIYVLDRGGYYTRLYLVLSIATGALMLATVGYVSLRTMGECCSKTALWLYPLGSVVLCVAQVVVAVIAYMWMYKQIACQSIKHKLEETRRKKTAQHHQPSKAPLVKKSQV